MRSSHLPEYNLATIKDKKYLENQLEAGKILSEIMNKMIDKVLSQDFDTYLSLSRFAELEILKHNAIPTFKSYKNFPEAVCISINNTLVHGIPKDIKPQSTDLVSLDFGVTVEQSIVDSAITLSAEPTEEDKLLISATQKCLYNSIKQIKLENRFGSIGENIFSTAKDMGFKVVNEFGGHGIGYGNPHDFPFISNNDKSTNGIRFQPGMTFAIEPLLYRNQKNISIDNDKWSINMTERCSHFEHSVHVLQDKLIILTLNKLDSIEKEIQL